MAGLNILWYVGAGFLLGWVLSTLTEWLWSRGRRVGIEPTGRGVDAGAHPNRRPPLTVFEMLVVIFSISKSPLY